MADNHIITGLSEKINQLTIQNINLEHEVRQAKLIHVDHNSLRDENAQLRDQVVALENALKKAILGNTTDATHHTMSKLSDENAWLREQLLAEAKRTEDLAIKLEVLEGRYKRLTRNKEDAVNNLTKAQDKIESQKRTAKNKNAEINRLKAKISSNSAKSAYGAKTSKGASNFKWPQSAGAEFSGYSPMFDPKASMKSDNAYGLNARADKSGRGVQYAAPYNQSYDMDDEEMTTIKPETSGKRNDVDGDVDGEDDVPIGRSKQFGQYLRQNTSRVQPSAIRSEPMDEDDMPLSARWAADRGHYGSH